jgi:hypothetical protein
VHDFFEITLIAVFNAIKITVVVSWFDITSFGVAIIVFHLQQFLLFGCSLILIDHRVHDTLVKILTWRYLKTVDTVGAIGVLFFVPQVQFDFSGNEGIIGNIHLYRG